jgi:hypothetical protein
MKGIVMKRRQTDLLKQAERLGRESGLDTRLSRYREQRKIYEGTVRGKDKRGASLPAENETAGAGPVRRRGPKGFAGDGLYT